MRSATWAGTLDPVYFTATGMIGMIALAGIVTRDSIILVDFIHLSLANGRSLFDAIMESRVVRLRPILLTASAAMLGAVPIIIDPIFSGLAWSLIFGLLASTLFTLFVIPVAYWLIYANKPGHGLPQSAIDQEELAVESPAVELQCSVKKRRYRRRHRTGVKTGCGKKTSVHSGKKFPRRCVVGCLGGSIPGPTLALPVDPTAVGT